MICRVTGCPLQHPVARVGSIARARTRARTRAGEAAPVAAGALVGGRSVLLIPHRSPGMGQDALPPECRKIMRILRAAGGPVVAKAVGEKLGIDVKSAGKLEPLRGKLSKLAGRGWARKLPDGRFQITP